MSLAWLAGVGLLMIVGVVAMVIVCTRPRKCAACGEPITLIPDAVDDDYLDAGQKMEEVLGSVDYQVWHCFGCNAQELIPKAGFLSSYTKCPQCDRRTVETSASVLEPATYTSFGMQLIRRHCHHCDFRDESRELIPMLKPAAERGRPTFVDDSWSRSSPPDTSSESTIDWGSFDSGSSGGSSGGSSSDGGRSSGGGASGSW
jgi:uncharacterized protein